MKSLQSLRPVVEKSYQVFERYRLPGFEEIRRLLPADLPEDVCTSFRSLVDGRHPMFRERTFSAPVVGVPYQVERRLETYGERRVYRALPHPNWTSEGSFIAPLSFRQGNRGVYARLEYRGVVLERGSGEVPLETWIPCLVYEQEAHRKSEDGAWQDYVRFIAKPLFTERFMVQVPADVTDAATPSADATPDAEPPPTAKPAVRQAGLRKVAMCFTRGGDGRIVAGLMVKPTWPPLVIFNGRDDSDRIEVAIDVPRWYMVECKLDRKHGLAKELLVDPVDEADRRAAFAATAKVVKREIVPAEPSDPAADTLPEPAPAQMVETSATEPAVALAPQATETSPKADVAAAGQSDLQVVSDDLRRSLDWRAARQQAQKRAKPAAAKKPAASLRGQLGEVIAASAKEGADK